MLVFSDALRTQMAQDIVDQSGTVPMLVFYNNTMPDTCEMPSTDTIIGMIALPVPFLSIASGQATLNGIWQTTALATGLIGYFRLINNGVCIFQGSVGAAYGAIWQADTVFNQGDVVLNGAGVYSCNISGTSAISGYGPNGTATGIIDGQTNWNYLGEVGDLNFSNANFILGQTITVSQFQLTIGNGSNE